ncbi:MAG TPA: PilZ domain-containing protein [Myxococcota bacterium]|nr:PilZ domain-containing protein [Myxococcota bacterium]
MLTSRIPVRFMAEGVEGVGQLKNLSRAGLFVRSNDLPRPEAAISLQLDVPGTGASLNLRGEVRWTTDGTDASDGSGDSDASSGFGVQLLEPSPEFSELFRWAVEQLEKPDQDPIA